MALNTLSAATVAEYLHIETTDPLINPLISAAKDYCCSFTGMELADLSKHEAVDVAALVWISDAYDQRTQHTDKPINNPTVETILSMYSRNLLQAEEVDGETEDGDEEEES